MPFSSSTYLITMRIYIDYTLQTCQNPAQSTCRPAAPKHLLFLQSPRMASLRRLAREIKKQQVSMTIEFDCSLNNSSTAFLTFFFKNQAIELKRSCPRLGVQCVRAVLAWCSPIPLTLCAPVSLILFGSQSFNMSSSTHHLPSVTHAKLALPRNHKLGGLARAIPAG